MQLKIRRNALIVVIFFLIVYLLSFPLSVEVPTQGCHTAPDFHQINHIPGQPAIFYEQRPPFLKFLKPVRAFLFKFKPLHWFKLRDTSLKYFATQNLCITIIVIALFVIFYRLSRVCSEEPGLQMNFNESL